MFCAFTLGLRRLQSNIFLFKTFSYFSCYSIHSLHCTVLFSLKPNWWFGIMFSESEIQFQIDLTNMAASLLVGMIIAMLDLFLVLLSKLVVKLSTFPFCNLKYEMIINYNIHNNKNMGNYFFHRIHIMGT